MQRGSEVKRDGGREKGKRRNGVHLNVGSPRLNSQVNLK